MQKTGRYTVWRCPSRRPRNSSEVLTFNANIYILLRSQRVRKGLTDSTFHGLAIGCCNVACRQRDDAAQQKQLLNIPHRKSNVFHRPSSRS